jgi:hypothetical protein
VARKKAREKTIEIQPVQTSGLADLPDKSPKEKYSEGSIKGGTIDGEFDANLELGASDETILREMERQNVVLQGEIVVLDCQISELQAQQHAKIEEVKQIRKKFDEKIIQCAQAAGIDVNDSSKGRWHMDFQQAKLAFKRI